MEDPQDLVPERKINTTEEETTWLRVREDAAARLRAATVSLQPRRLLACVKFVYAQEELAKPIRTNARKSSRKTWCQDELDPGIQQRRLYNDLRPFLRNLPGT